MYFTTDCCRRGRRQLAPSRRSVSLIAPKRSKARRISPAGLVFLRPDLCPPQLPSIIIDAEPPFPFIGNQPHHGSGHLWRRISDSRCTCRRLCKHPGAVNRCRIDHLRSRPALRHRRLHRTGGQSIQQHDDGADDDTRFFQGPGEFHAAPLGLSHVGKTIVSDQSMTLARGLLSSGGMNRRYERGRGAGVSSIPRYGSRRAA